MMEIYSWIIANGGVISSLVIAIMAVLAIIVRLTPTATDDGWFAILDKWVNTILDFLKIPNTKK